MSSLHQYPLVRGCGLLIALNLVAGAAWAQQNPYPVNYEERLWWGAGSHWLQATVPHEAVVTYENPGPFGTGGVQTSSSPVPFVSAYVESQIPQGYNAALSIYSGGSINYFVGVNGPAGALVPISFSGVFSQSNSAWSGGDVYLSVFTNTSSSDSNFRRTCRMWPYTIVGDECNVHVQGEMVAAMSDATQGSFSGQTFARTDADGHAWISVFLSAEAWAVNDGTASTFVDPSFQIAPAFLALNPGASLVFQPGLGNSSVSQVPEPASAALLVAGIAALGFKARRRRDPLVA